VDERLLYDTFSAFGMMATTAKVCFLHSLPQSQRKPFFSQIARDPSTGVSKGYGFVSYTDFESSDAAIESMNGQFLMNKAITVQYAFKKDGKGERHGTSAERLLAAQARKNNALPVAARPPPVAPAMAFGTPGVATPMVPGAPVARPPGVPGYPAPYQAGQFAGALAAAPPPPPPGFAPQQTIVPGMMPPPMPMGMQMGGMPPPMGAVPPSGMGMMPPPPPAGVPVYGAYGVPPGVPPPPGFGGQFPPPPPVPQQQY